MNDDVPSSRALRTRSCVRCPCLRTVSMRGSGLYVAALPLVQWPAWTARLSLTRRRTRRTRRAALGCPWRSGTCHLGTGPAVCTRGRHRRRWRPGCHPAECNERASRLLAVHGLYGQRGGMQSNRQKWLHCPSALPDAGENCGGESPLAGAKGAIIVVPLDGKRGPESAGVLMEVAPDGWAFVPLKEDRVWIPRVESLARRHRVDRPPALRRRQIVGVVQREPRHASHATAVERVRVITRQKFGSAGRGPIGRITITSSEASLVRCCHHIMACADAMIAGKAPPAVPVLTSERSVTQ